MASEYKGQGDPGTVSEMSAGSKVIEGQGEERLENASNLDIASAQCGPGGDALPIRTSVDKDSCSETSNQSEPGHDSSCPDRNETPERSVQSDTENRTSASGCEDAESSPKTNIPQSPDVLCSKQVQSTVDDEDADFVDAKDRFEEEDADGWQDASDVVVTATESQDSLATTTGATKVQSENADTRTTLGTFDETKQKQSENQDETPSSSSGDGQSDADAFVAQAMGGDDEDKKEEEDKETSIDVDETARLEMEAAMTEEEKQAKRDEAQEHKKSGNDLFKTGEYLDSISAYTEALELCPLEYKKDRSVMFANRGACRVRLEHHEEAIEDCTKALELNPVYLKVYLRRAQVYELTDKLDEALADFQKALELDPGNYEARAACLRLPDQIKERNEKLKEEMMGKLKDLGNLVLRPFGLSTENFQLQQDPNSGGYSINFNQNPTNGN